MASRGHADELRTLCALALAGLLPHWAFFHLVALVIVDWILDFVAYLGDCSSQVSILSASVSY